MEQNKIQEKQMFLRQCILEAGFDVESFTQYLEHIKPGQAQDINTWEIDELKEIVKQYTELKVKEQQQIMIDLPDVPIKKLSQEQIEQQTELLDQIIQNKKPRKVSGEYECIFQKNKEEKKTDQEQFYSNRLNQFLKNIDQKSVEEEMQEQNEENDENEEKQQKMNEQISEENKVNNTKGSLLNKLNIFQIFSSQQEKIEEPLQDLQAQRERIIYEEPDKQFKARIQCVRQNESVINKVDQVVKVKIDKFEVVKGGYFSQDYVVYEVKCNQIGSVVKRRFSEFEQLRTILSKVFPGMILPPMPGKKKKSFEKSHLIKRANNLQRTMNRLLEIESIKGSNILFDFLSVIDIKKVMKSWEKRLRCRRVEEIENREGVIDIEVDEGVYIHNKAYQVWQEEQQAHLFKCISLSKTLQAQLNQATHTMFSLADTMQEMNSSMKEFNSKVIQKDQQHNLQEIYLSLNNLLLLWGNHFMEQAKTSQQLLTVFFRYESNSLNAHKEILKGLNDQRELFYREKERIQNKKEKLFIQGDIQRWEIAGHLSNRVDKMALMGQPEVAYQVMCTQENQQLQVNADILGYLQSIFYQQTRSSFKRDQTTLVNHFSRLSKHNVQCLHLMQNANEDCEQHLASLNSQIQV